MDNLDEIFDGMPEPDAGLDFVIDESKRLIAVPEEGVVLGVEGDKDVNRIRLRINRYYRGSDLADFAIRVNYENAEGDRNYFTVTEKTVTEQTITFIWVVAADAVAYKGAVHFAVSFYRVNDSGEILQKYNTTLGTVQNLVGLEVSAAQDDPVVVDFMAHLKNDITEHAATYENAMNEAARSADASAQNAKSSADDAKQSEEATKALLEKASTEYNGGCLGRIAVTLPVDGWTKGEGETVYSCTAAVEKATSACLPMAGVISADVPSAMAAGMYGVCEAGDGTLKFWATSKPTQALTLSVMLLVPDVQLEG